MIVNFNRLKLYLLRPSQLQPKLHNIKEDTGLPTNLTVGGPAVFELPGPSSDREHRTCQPSAQ